MQTSTESPPAHRLRSRNASYSIPTPTSPTSSGTSKSKAKGKPKQVEFNDAVQVHSPSRRCAKGKDHAQHPNPEDSDLTELDELEKTFRGQPSPRRLRGKDRELEKSKGKDKVDPDATPIANPKRRKQIRTADVDEQADDSEVRVTPMRKAKGKIRNLKESDTEQEGTEEEHDELEDDENVQDEGQEEEEVDELVSSASTTPPPEIKGRRTPLRRRLRPRKTPNKTASEEDDENEGDDEEEDENEEDHSGHRVQSIDPRNRTISNVFPSQRPSFMRLGNFSTPYLRKGESYRPNLLPIGNNPHSKQPRSGSTFRQPFFVDRKHDVLSPSTYDFFKYAQEHPPTLASPTSPESSSPRRPSTADHVTVWRNNQRAQESLRRLDGMLIQHMEDEKDTIKRIATTLKHTSPTNSIP